MCDIIIDSNGNQVNLNYADYIQDDLQATDLPSKQELKSSIDFETTKEFIIKTKSKIIEPKDFTDEIRCKRDIDLFLQNPHIILNCQISDFESIIHQMISCIIEGKNEINAISEQIFADKSTLLTNLTQGIYLSDDNEYQYDHSWLCTNCSSPLIQNRKICISRLSQPTNFGISTHDIRFVVLILTPVKEKFTKSAEELSVSFGSLFADYIFRSELLRAHNEVEFIGIIEKRALSLVNKSQVSQNGILNESEDEKSPTSFRLSFGKGLAENFKRRLHYYKSDYIDGFFGENTIHKTIATTVSLYLAIILPSIAFGVLDDKNTNGLIDPRRALIGQTIGGIIFALLGGQPLVVIMTTAPICLFTKVVFDISADFQVDFYDMFACVGLWNAFFVIIYSVFDLSVLMKYCTRSTEEIFGLFTFVAFSSDAIRNCVKNFNENYCIANTNTDSLSNSSLTFNPIYTNNCAQQNSVLFLFLMLSTAWFAITIYDFKNTPYLSSHKREILADYALPIAVFTFSFVGTYLFRDINAEKFEFSESFEFRITTLKSLTINSILVSMALGFALSLLFFMDQNISASMVNSPNNKLKKGGAYHWDLLVVGILNAFLSVFSLPWMNGMLPHSPIHARSLADVEQHVTDGHVREIVVKARETRVTFLSCNILIGLSLFLIPEPLDYIPVSVLDGLFLYCAIASLRGNSFFERILLFITEQSSYPPTHYIRRCPQKKIHIFTIIQLIQLGILCFFGFNDWSYVKMAFPVIIAILLPVRWKIVPLFMEEKHIKAIDGFHE